MITNRQLILPYAAPYLAYVGIASLPEESLALEINYLLRLVAVSLLLCWAWRWYCPLRGPRSPFASVLAGGAAGLLGLVIWIALLTPFVKPGIPSSWSAPSFLLRLFCAGLIVPLFEELLMRGFLFRLALQWDTARKNKENHPLHIALDQRSVNEIAPGSWSWLAVILSTLAFTSGHLVHEWPAAIAYGLFMAFLWVIRKDLLTCIAAHAVTNTALAVYVSTTGQWQYW